MAGAASSSASRSCARSTSWTSSTRSSRQRSRQRASRAASPSSAAIERRTRSSKSRPPVAATARSYATKARAIGPAAGSAATSSGRHAQLDLEPRDSPVSSREHRRLVSPRARPRRGRVAVGQGSTATPASRRISRPSAWNVRTGTAPGSTPSGATAASSRSVISTAARLLKVSARIASGGVPVAISHAARAHQGGGLAAPGRRDAQDGPDGAVAAARWSGASRARRSTTGASHQPASGRSPVG